MKTEPIQDYILKSEQNLRIASAVGEAWPDAREKLVSAFFDRLDIRLKRKLNGWKFERWGGHFFVAAYPAYYFWKPAWEDQYYLALQSYDYGQRMIFGVQREKNRIGKRPFSEQLLDAVREVQPSAGIDSWWAVRITLSVPAPDWRKPEVLWQMHKDGKFLESVAEQLLEVATISEPIVDRLVRKE
jgi:hypothetical protein